jgi:hypothetical protein
MGDTDPDHMAGNCKASDAQFVDENVPNYRVLQKGETPPADVKFPNGKALDPTPSKGPQSSVVRLGDLMPATPITCADVRAAFK